MASLYLSWDNSAALANANALAQRVYWRLKSTGGAFNTSNFSPANDLAKAISAAIFTAATVNAIYEFKVATLCSTGGPTDNGNGIIEGIVFACFPPTLLEADENSVTVNISIPGDIDITQAKLTLKKQSDNSVVETDIVLVVDSNIDKTFTGLTASTGYYLEVEFYSVVNGVEVISSSINYLNAVCGGNVTGFQIETGSTAVGCNAYKITGTPECEAEWDDCDTGDTLSATFTASQDVCARTGSVSITSGAGDIALGDPC